jgi:hypothetical protein
MNYKAVESVLTYPDGFNALTLVEGEECKNLEPSALAFLLERGLIAPVLPVVERETKPASKVTRRVQTKKKKVVDEIKGNNTADD